MDSDALAQRVAELEEVNARQAHAQSQLRDEALAVHRWLRRVGVADEAIAAELHRLKCEWAYRKYPTNRMPSFAEAWLRASVLRLIDGLSESCFPLLSEAAERGHTRMAQELHVAGADLQKRAGRRRT